MVNSSTTAQGDNGSTDLERLVDSYPACLEFLGIKQTADHNGQPALSIPLDLESRSQHQSWQAVFSAGSRTWKLEKKSLPADLDDHDRRDTQHPSFGDQVNKSTDKPDRSFLERDDWANLLLPDSDHVKLFRERDWRATSLGALRSWPKNLRSAIQIMLADCRAVALFWGPDRVAIYNEAYVPLAGHSHPAFFGAPFQKLWPEIWEDFADQFDNIERTGHATISSDSVMYLDRHAYLEETWFNISLAPVRDDMGDNGGILNTAQEVTRQALLDRRTKITNSMAAPPDLRIESIWKHILSVLEMNAKDAPMAILYAFEESLDVISSPSTLKLQGTLGVPPDHVAAPQEVDLQRASNGFFPTLRRVKISCETVVLRREDGSLSDTLLEGFWWRGFGEPCTDVAVILLLASEDYLLGFLIFGLNPRRAFDKDHHQFVQELSRQLTAVLASALSFDQAQKREARLSQELADSERRIRKMAEVAPVGMIDISDDGMLLWANPQYYDITGHPTNPKELYKKSFVDVVHEEDREKGAAACSKAFDEQKVVSVAVRLKKKFRPPPSIFNGPDLEHTWILGNVYPNVENGVTKGLFACITDISQFKWAELVQARSAEAATKAKRLQEEFIDFTSHEMRNPLSAITQCADGICSSVAEYKSALNGRQPGRLQDILEDNTEAARTILMCCAHQRRIVDDILTLSKLDSMLLSITPVPVQPSAIVLAALRMFEAEFLSNDIHVDTMAERLEDDVDFEWVYCDPTRLTQIFVNLLTNAIKFTRTESKRSITIHFGASASHRPKALGRDIQWYPTGKSRPDLTVRPEWGIGESLYVYFAVTDTGRGLEHDETTRLFNRFAQANPRTHVQYGGSGLGLFISRELSEMQGGEIGVESKKGEGSTFAYYIKARRAPAPGITVSGPENSAVKNASTEDLLSFRVHRRGSSIGKADQAGGVSKEVEKPSKEPLAKFHILLVEDNLVNQKVLRKQLTKAGCTVDVANHGLEALEYLRKSSAWDAGNRQGPGTDLDVVLMDIEMPVMDGLTCTKKIRELEQQGRLLQHLNVVAITANARAEQVMIAREAGVDDVLSKPFRVPELIERMKALGVQSNRIDGNP